MRAHDDRGRLVKVIPGYRFGGAGVLWCPLPRKARILVRDRLQGEPWTEYYVPLAVLVALWLLVFAFMTRWMTSMIRTTGTMPWYFGIGQGLVIPLSMFPVMYRAMWRMRRRVARFIVIEGHCATCGYSLDGVEPGADGCTVCPECGSAWNRSIQPPRGSDSSPLASEFASVFCRDDRAGRIPLHRQWRAGTLPGIASPVPRRFRGSLQRVQPDRDTSRRAARSMGVLLLGLIAWFVFWVQVGAPRLTSLQIRSPQASILRVAIPAAPIPLFVVLLLGVSRQRTANILAAAGYCGACGENLAGLSLSHDLCTVCPECGSAWRIGSPHARDAAADEGV